MSETISGQVVPQEQLKQQKTNQEIAAQIGRIAEKLIERGQKSMDFRDTYGGRYIDPAPVERAESTATGTTINGYKTHKMKSVDVTDINGDSASVAQKNTNTADGPTRYTSVSGDIGNLNANIAVEEIDEGHVASVSGNIVGYEQGIEEELSDKGIISHAANQFSRIRSTIAEREIAKKEIIAAEMQGVNMVEQLQPEPLPAPESTPLLKY